MGAQQFSSLVVVHKVERSESLLVSEVGIGAVVDEKASYSDGVNEKRIQLGRLRPCHQFEHLRRPFVRQVRMRVSENPFASEG